MFLQELFQDPKRLLWLLREDVRDRPEGQGFGLGVLRLLAASARARASRSIVSRSPGGSFWTD